VWRRDQPPPDMSQYERALKYVLDDLHFSRFRFPGVTAAAGGTWQGIKVFDSPAPQQLADATWISGAAFTQSQPTADADGASRHWSRIAGHAAAQSESFGGATLAGYTEKSTAWVQYEFDSKFADPIYVWLQVQPHQTKERKVVSLDGKELGALSSADFAR